MKDISPEVVTVKAVMFEENVKLFISNQMENLLGGESCLEDVFSSQQKGDFHLNDCVRVLESFSQKLIFFFFLGLHSIFLIVPFLIILVENVSAKYKHILFSDLIENIIKTM